MSSAPPVGAAREPSGTTQYSARQLARTRLLADAIACSAAELLGDARDASPSEPQALIELADELERVAMTLVGLVSDLQGSDPVQVLQVAFLALDQPYPD